MKNRFNILHGVAGILLLISILFLFNTARAAASTGLLLVQGTRGPGKVVRVEGRQVPGPLRKPARTYCPIVRFRDHEGRVREFTGECQAPPLAREGETVRVIFTAGQARIYGLWNIYLRNLVSLGAGLLALAGAVVAYRKARNFG